MALKSATNDNIQNAIADVDDNHASQLIPFERIHISFFDNQTNVLERLGYKLGRIIGEGTYSKVREVDFTTRPQQQKLAVKIIDRKHASKDFVSKFLPREITILSKISHPNIIKVHRILELNEDIHIFMDLAQIDLLAYVQIVVAVKYLHERNICHRDLKCENILLFPDLVIKLSDFGFAKEIVKKSSNKIQMSKTYCGSAAYAAPEILSGIPYEPQLCDIWSMGCILFILLTSCMPFDDINLKTMLHNQIARMAKFPSDFENKVGPAGKDLIEYENCGWPNAGTVYPTKNLREWNFKSHMDEGK